MQLLLPLRFVIKNWREREEQRQLPNAVCDRNIEGNVRSSGSCRMRFVIGILKGTRGAAAVAAGCGILGRAAWNPASFF